MQRSALPLGAFISSTNLNNSSPCISPLFHVGGKDLEGFPHPALASGRELLARIRFLQSGA